jgi:hypothetical protein
MEVEPPEPEPVVVKPKTKPFATLSQKLTQFGLFIDNKISEVKL